MDLGIAGRWAVVCAASKGLGKGCAVALAREGVNLVINARGEAALAETADELRALNAAIDVRSVVGDVTQESVRQALLAAAPQVDILVNNAGGPPPGDFRDWKQDDWLAALQANMLTPIELMRATVDGMAERGFGRVVNITSAAVKAPIDVLGLSNGARSGLTGFVAGLARQPRLAGRNVTLNNLLPGPFETDRLRKTLGVPGQREKRLAAIPMGRFGNADEFGAVCAFLCSVHAGYMTGQNVLLDGGGYPGTF
ncbi:SDR family oxidoreductase [Bordetella genomosp. 13]|uniref:SDR family oxidoreductase n=1 Tax=Bordetella genomosp. 13 TaxID=463040 RepID=UPI0011A02854|nr:SDR family oxidoreductase [Bordetella genomosp. 13]